jgi:L-amino acid N-acyltransferase YncA
MVVEILHYNDCLSDDPKRFDRTNRSVAMHDRAGFAHVGAESRGDFDT